VQNFLLKHREVVYPEYERLEKQCNELLRERTILQLKIMNLEKNTVYQEKEADDDTGRSGGHSGRDQAVLHAANERNAVRKP
jgi:hypothetical protein